MAKYKIIKAPSKILWKLRFQNRCLMCGKIIPAGSSICDGCKRRMRG